MSTASSALALHLPFAPPIATTASAAAIKLTYPISSSRWSASGLRLVGSAHAAISGSGQGTFDPELRSVLELATNSELYELERILFGPRTNVDYAMVEEDLDKREEFLTVLESRFLFLAADARSTISEESGNFEGLLEFSEPSDGQHSLQFGLSQWKVQALSALKVGAAELRSMFLKAIIFTLAKIYQLLARKLSGKVFLEAAKYQLKRDFVRRGGQLAAINLESGAALLAAKQGFAGATSRYLGLRSMMALLGPVLWGTFLADVVIQMLGTDYARILRAIYAFAQIRITGTYRLPPDC
ncbi:hypothetical protein DVH24_023454 [Malus domestica]|uniref:Uncharacterized protein n=1 Tax=Malus domestica TaxID=3750 RepID=A0A498I214_MALDO|nr:hypothetical protein DVH24_023454 [Malus domestica]